MSWKQSHPGMMFIQRMPVSLRDRLEIQSEDGTIRMYKTVPSGGYLVPRTLRKAFDGEIVESYGAGGYLEGGARMSLACLPEVSLWNPETHPTKPDQLATVDRIEAILRRDKGTILEADCGVGKTVMGLELIRRLGLPTVVLMNGEYLADQWAEEAQEFLPGARTGIWQRDRMDSGKDFDIVYASISSVISKKRNYPRELYESFGFLVVDEVHHMGADKWRKAIPKFPAAYRLGLTADKERRDGLQILFIAHIGKTGVVLRRVKTRLTMPTVWMMRTEAHIPKKDLMFPWDKHKVNTGKMITTLANDRQRTDFIVSWIVKGIKQGHKILALTERRKHVDELLDLSMAQLEGYTGAIIVGGMKTTAIKEAAKCDLIVGTYKMAQEALDLPARTAGYLATPKVDIKQAVGRIQRDAGDLEPIIMDFTDIKIPILKGYALARQKRYDALELTVKNRVK